MPTTLVNLAAEVTFALGNRTELATLAKTWVNRSYMWLQDVIEFPESHTTTSFNTANAVATYAAPSDFFSIFSMRNVTNNQKLHQVGFPSYDRYSLLRTGPPTIYALRGRSSILLWPVPNAIYSLTVTYRKTLAAITTDAALHVLPDAWEEAIIFGATAYGFEYLNEIERARQARSSRNAVAAQLTDRVAADLVDRNEPIAPVGIETGVRP